MAADQIPSTSQVRKVRIGMRVNGAQVDGALLSFGADSKGYLSADTWSAEIALDGLPDGYGAPFWALQDKVEVQLLAALSGTVLSPIISGMVDDIDIDMEAQRMTISGRDHSAPLIDSISNDKLQNQTSSQIAAKFAERRGLTPQVTSTTLPVGRFFSNQSGYLAEDISEWRVLSFLAEQEGFDLYVSGKSLVFAPAKTDPAPIILRYSYAGSGQSTVAGNGETLRLRQRKVLAGKVTVQVRSWQHQTKQAIISTWVSQKTAAISGKPKSAVTVTRAQAQSGASAEGQFYIFRRSGLTQQQADEFAQKRLADIASHEREIEYSGPGIIGIDARRTCRLVGTGLAFDQDYPIKSLSRSFSWDRGCSMKISAKNGSPQEATKL